MFETLLYEKQPTGLPGGDIVWVTLNRPDKLNALNLQMRDDLWAALDVASLDPDAGAVIFKGAGDRAFSAGADISEFGTAPSIIDARRARQERDLWGRMAAFEKPMIAAVHGWALGAGCEMGLLCDVRIASEDARFGLPEVNLGYIPSAGGTQTLPRLIGRGNALYMVLTGDPIDAATALDFGLVEWVVPRDQLYAKAEEVALAILSRPPAAVRKTKEAVLRGLDLPLAEGLKLEALLAQELTATEQRKKKQA